MRTVSACALLMLCGSALADGRGDLANVISSARAWRQANERAIVSELVEFVRIPNETRDKDNILKNATYLLGMMERRGLSPRMLQLPEAAPVLYGEWLVPGASSTYVFYAH